MNAAVYFVGACSMAIRKMGLLVSAVWYNGAMIEVVEKWLHQMGYTLQDVTN